MVSQPSSINSMYPYSASSWNNMQPSTQSWSPQAASYANYGMPGQQWNTNGSYGYSDPYAGYSGIQQSTVIPTPLAAPPNYAYPGYGAAPTPDSFTFQQPASPASTALDQTATPDELAASSPASGSPATTNSMSNSTQSKKSSSTLMWLGLLALSALGLFLWVRRGKSTPSIEEEPSAEAQAPATDSPTETAPVAEEASTTETSVAASSTELQTPTEAGPAASESATLDESQSGKEGPFIFNK